MELTSLNQAKDEVFGPVGTPERDRYEQELAEEIRCLANRGRAGERTFHGCSK